jgi:hypothetical protein
MDGEVEVEDSTQIKVKASEDFVAPFVLHRKT